jgi:hypothetical protein
MKTLNQMLGANRRLIARVIALIPMIALALASAQAGTVTTSLLPFRVTAILILTAWPACPPPQDR